jgi:hypothetical protein
VLMALATCLLNVPSLFFEPLAYWVRILVAILFAIGFVGTLRGSSPVRSAGWIGLLLFGVVMLTAVLPGEDYTLGGPGAPLGTPPHLPSHTLVVARLLAFLAVVVGLMVCYGLAGRNSQMTSGVSSSLQPLQGL